MTPGPFAQTALATLAVGAILGGCSLLLSQRGLVGDSSDADCDVRTDAGPLSLVQVNTTGAAAPSPATVTLSNVTPGHLLLLGIFWDSTASVSVSDTMTNSWTYASPQKNTLCSSTGDTAQVQFWYAISQSSGSDTVTVSAPNAVGFLALEYSGLTGAVSSESPGGGGQIDTSVASMSAGTLSTPCGRDLVVALFYWATYQSNPVNAGAGFTTEAISDNVAIVEDDLPFGAEAGTYTPTAAMPTVAGCWTATAIALRAQ